MLRSACLPIKRLNPRVVTALWDVAGSSRSHKDPSPPWLATKPRFFSSSNDNDQSTSASVDETLNKLFQENKLTEDAPSTDVVPTEEVWSAGATTLAEYVPSSWYNLSDQSIIAIQQVHEFTGWEYGLSIVALTTGLRLVLFPVMAMAQQTTSRMAHVQPELQALQNKIKRLGTPTRDEQMKFANQYKGLFRKYKIQPMWAFVAPVFQIPIFAGLFFGLRKMPDLFPQELSAAGMLWFPDLTQPDPTYVLPIMSSAAVLAMFELSKKQMAAQSPGQQGVLMVHFFRLMAVGMVPVTINFNTSVLLMWTTNSSLMLIQTALLQNSIVRRAFGIWELPKPVPGQETKGIAETFTDMAKKAQGEAVTEAQKIAEHNQQVEARKTSFRMARERRRRQGVTRTRNG